MTCATAEECNEGDACFDLDGSDATVDDQVCFPGCTSSDECRGGWVCNVNFECEQPSL